MSEIFTAWLSLPRTEEMSSKTITYVIASHVFWFTMFFIVGLNLPLPKAVVEKTKPYDRLVLRHRFIQASHGIICILTGLYWYIAKWDTTCGKKIDDFELLMLVNTSAHFIWDCLFMQYHGFLDAGNLIHHGMGIISYYFSAYQQHNHNLCVLNILPAELTNVNLHLREIYRRIGWRYTWAFYWNEYQFSAMYLPIRCLWIPACYYWMYPCSTLNPAVLLIYPLHVVQGWYYVSFHPKLIKGRTREVEAIKKAGLKLEWFTPIDEATIKEKKIVTTREPYTM